jgi:uroporphyrinogen-III synthase
MIPDEAGYRSFLLRMWCVKQDHEIAWRASMENPRTGQQLFFTTREALDEFLRKLGEDLENELEIKDG